MIAGKYVLERPLARGGMGAVWLARHRDLDAEVAIKFMTDAFVSSSEARARFEREAKAAARLDTRHVAHVRDYGVDGETPYIVMELLKGEDLAARLARQPRLSLPAASTMVLQIAKGLRKAHEAGLVHRDLKPANIFLAITDDEEVVKILDFGIAKATGTGLAGQATASGVVIGSVHYMSPEQVRRSKEVDRRSDLWSLAVILFRMVTGRLPFMGEEIGDVLVKVCADPVPVPSDLAPDLPAEVDAFFARALSRSPDDRFQSAQEMAEAFAVVARAPRISRPPTASASDTRAPTEADGGMNVLTLVKTQVWQPEQETLVLLTPEPASSRETLNPSQRTLGGRPGDRRRTLVWIASGALSLAALVVAVWLAQRRSHAPISPSALAGPSAPIAEMTATAAPIVSAPTVTEPDVPAPATASPSAAPTAGVPAAPPKMAAPAISPVVVMPNRRGSSPKVPAHPPRHAPTPSTAAEKPIDLP